MSPLILPWEGVAPVFGERVFIAPNATLIGDVAIGDDAGIWFGAILRGDVKEIRVGARTNLQDGAILHGSKHGTGVHVGQDVTVGHGAIIHACRVEDGAFVGMGAVIMDDAVIESGALIAACALVPPGKRVPSGELWGGNPARKMRDLTEAERRDLTKTAARYVEYGQTYRRML
jgi:carbonic anhydrase/acetyltransferase-like protein (isoleucine patch superfamily)